MINNHHGPGGKYSHLNVFISGLASCQDNNLNLSEQVFESEFHKLYPSSKDEAKAAAALAAAEKQVALLAKAINWHYPYTVPIGP